VEKEERGSEGQKEEGERKQRGGKGKQLVMGEGGSGKVGRTKGLRKIWQGSGGGGAGK